MPRWCSTQQTYPPRKPPRRSFFISSERASLEWKHKPSSPHRGRLGPSSPRHEIPCRDERDRTGVRLPGGPAFGRLRNHYQKVMVGTDIVLAIVLTGVSSFLQFQGGNVDPSLVGILLIGSVAGGLLGSYLSARIPVLWLRRLLCGILLATGARMVRARA
ncbi:MAG TPA: sulfite exporter TauE/SafE family protein [Terriglobales bacterium]|nr:sulfite exporter TauE/SafE family protein [Terriglobales bacterium]